MTAAARKYSHEGVEALAALKRARRRAEQVARATHTMLVEARDGQPILVPPPEEDDDNDRG